MDMPHMAVGEIMFTLIRCYKKGQNSVRTTSKT